LPKTAYVGLSQKLKKENADLRSVRNGNANRSTSGNRTFQQPNKENQKRPMHLSSGTSPAPFFQPQKGKKEGTARPASIMVSPND